MATRTESCVTAASVCGGKSCEVIFLRQVTAMIDETGMSDKINFFRLQGMWKRARGLPIDLIGLVQLGPCQWQLLVKMIEAMLNARDCVSFIFCKIFCLFWVTHDTAIIALWCLMVVFLLRNKH